MKQIMIIKVAFAIALLFTPSIMMADKIEVQDSIIIIVGKGQTNKKGDFTANDTIGIDSILIDEIALTYKERQKLVLNVVDSISNDTLFSHMVTNGMSKDEMKDLSFSLLAGHTYIIQHGDKMRRNVIFPSPQNKGSIENIDSIDSIKNVNIKGKESDETNYSWLLWFIGGIIVGSGSFYLFKKIRSINVKNHKQENLKDDTVPEENDVIDPIISTDEEIQNDTEEQNIDNDPDISKLKDDAEKGKKRLKRLKRIAVSLELNEDQLNQIEHKIDELKEKANQNKQIDKGGRPDPKGYENIYTAQEVAAKELLRKFEERDIFTKTIEKAREKARNRYYIKEREILRYLIDEIAEKLEQKGLTSDKNHEPVNDTTNVVESDSHPEWLKKRLKDLFDFTYNSKESVKKNLEKLIEERMESFPGRDTSGDTTLNVDIDKKVVEKKSKKEKSVKEEEINGLKDQLKKKDKIISELNGQIESKDNIIIEKEQDISNKEVVISEKTQIICNKDSELQGLKEKHKMELQTEVEKLVGRLLQYTNAIEWRPMLDPCGNDDTTMNQCTDIESRLNEKLRQMKERLCGFARDKNATPEQTRAAIQKALKSEITIDESVVNSLCRLYAYSNLAFMTDMKREYGVRLRRKNIHEVYEALENLYIQFGIKFLIPPLFVMESKDGDYENVTGQVYSELGNLCPNVNNHCDNIDSEMRLKDIIVDIDSIGYTIDGSVQRNARILTF